MSEQPEEGGLLNAALDVIRQAASGKPYANQAELARAVNVSEANISRWLSGAATPTLKILDPVLQVLGVRLVLPSELDHQSSTDLIVSGSVDSRKYPLVPLKGSAGMSPIPDDDNSSTEWIPVPGGRQEMMQNISAWRVSERGMLPLLTPGDIVLVEEGPVGRLRSNEIYLVQEPPSYGGRILFRRASKTPLGEPPAVFFYADNVQEGFTAIIYSLRLYPNSDIRQAVLGRAVRLWADLDARMGH